LNNSKNIWKKSNNSNNNNWHRFLGKKGKTSDKEIKQKYGPAFEKKGPRPVLPSRLQAPRKFFDSAEYFKTKQSEGGAPSGTTAPPKEKVIQQQQEQQQQQQQQREQKEQKKLEKSQEEEEEEEEEEPEEGEEKKQKKETYTVPVAVEHAAKAAANASEPMGQSEMTPEELEFFNKYGRPKPSHTRVRKQRQTHFDSADYYKDQQAALANKKPDS